MLTHHHTTTARTPSRLPTPPPLALDLSHAGRPVGWVRGDTIGFRGFASTVEAAHAAWVAYRALAQRLAKAGGRRPLPVDAERLTLSRRGDVDVILAGGRPIATLVRPGPASHSGDSFGFELRVPAPTYETRLRAMAYLTYRALRKSGVRWALWAREGRAKEPRIDAPVASQGLQSPDPSSEPTQRGGARRWATMLTLITTASVVGLVLALVVPDHLALPLGLLGLTGLLGGRLLAPRTWGPAPRPIRRSIPVAGRPSEDAAMTSPVTHQQEEQIS